MLTISLVFLVFFICIYLHFLMSMSVIKPQKVNQIDIPNI